MSADARQFVDTNILVCAHDRSAGDKHDRARELVEGLWAARTGCLSIQVLQEFYVSLTRKIARPLSAETARTLVEHLGHWEVHRPSVADVLAAVGLHRQHGISFWDAMILQSAGQMGCRILWSEDLTGGQEYAGVRVRNPFREET